MAVTIRTMTVAKIKSGKTFFALSAYTADGQGAEVIKAAPASGNIYIEKLVVSGDFDGFVTIGDGEDTSAVETEALDIVVTATGISTVIDFKRPIKLTAAKALTFDCSAAGAISILVEGYVI